jgi:hypothetical protein
MQSEYPAINASLAGQRRAAVSGTTGVSKRKTSSMSRGRHFKSITRHVSRRREGDAFAWAAALRTVRRCARSSRRLNQGTGGMEIEILWARLAAVRYLPLTAVPTPAARPTSQSYIGSRVAPRSAANRRSPISLHRHGSSADVSVVSRAVVLRHLIVVVGYRQRHVLRRKPIHGTLRAPQIHAGNAEGSTLRLSVPPCFRAFTWSIT